MNLNTVSGIQLLATETLADILSYLPGRSLTNVLLVCRLWKELAQRELSRRNHFVCRVYRSNSRSVKHIVADIGRHINEILNDTRIVPSAAIIITRHLSRLLPEITPNLPKNCVVIGTQKTGGLIVENNKGPPFEFKQVNKHVSILLIPKVPGVNVSLLQMSYKDVSGKDKPEKWETKFDHLVGKDIKFVFLIGNMTSCGTYSEFCSNMFKILGEHVIVSGGVASKLSIAYSKGETKSSMIAGLAFGGNVEASSVVCDEEYFLPETSSIIPLLQELGSKHTPCLGRPTACFLTPCVAIRDDLLRDLGSLEFKKAFPEMKTFGFRCFGEIGTEPCKSRGNDGKVQNVLPRGVFHSYSVVLSVLKFL
ncbi:F-box only protein 22-like [Dendronephthya gigantea]|uniref:F-box only protein 22-like n=1 Tax=Dendronephthya gigantea TaxID=151771 RepID=UPI00106CF9C8|nr:F-box only protein 22-like [Dendronephthya gigantea]